MTHKDIIEYFNGHTVPEIAAKFQCTRRLVYDWAKMDHVPEVVSLRADFMTGGDLEHDPSLYGANYKRGEYRVCESSHAERMQSS